jgi:hypothetical protein
MQQKIEDHIRKHFWMLPDSVIREIAKKLNREILKAGQTFWKEKGLGD